VNCVNGPQAMLQLFAQLPEMDARLGFPQRWLPAVSRRSLSQITPRRSILPGRAVGTRRPRAGLVGGCCGTTPRHIAAIGEALLAAPGGQKAPVQISVAKRCLPPRESRHRDR
jgi:methionine synthase I (cobalamin-dependent)